MKRDLPRIVTVTPPGSRLKVECRVFRTHDAMLKSARRLIGNTYPNLTNDTAAYCEATIRFMPKGHLAIIFLNREEWTHGVIAHEFDHAGVALMYRRGHRTMPLSIDMATDEEEEHCSIVEHLVDEFYKKYGPL